MISQTVMIAELVISIILLIIMLAISTFHNVLGKIAIASLLVSMAFWVVNCFVISVPALEIVTLVTFLIAFALFVVQLILCVFAAL